MGFFIGKVYTVTGAGSGIAREVTLILAKKGATVYASDINAKGLEQTKSLAEGKVIIDTVDVRNANAVEAWVKSCFDKEGRLDGSANCAEVNGGSEQATILEKTVITLCNTNFRHTANSIS
jgi:NAD(P)-dependent dehydrogenase (short-subunit alcohol dehydrogenase family)